MEMNLSEFKKNIISWYPINKEKEVLQIGKNDEIYEELKTKAEKVVLLENYKNKDITSKFDFIVIIGEFEKLHTELEIKDLLDFAQNLLKEDGKILIGMQNKFGMKYWSGIKYNKNLKPYETIENNTQNIFSFQKIKNILTEMEFKFKFYYPLPDYKFTNVIYTDEFLPDNESIDARDLIYCEYNEVLSFSERDAYKQILNQDKKMFPFFANSFFIEVSKKDNFEDIKYVSYSISRKKDLRIETVIHNDFVSKKANSEKAINHIENVAKNIKILSKANLNCLDKFENNIIISKYLNDAKSFDKVVFEVYKKEGLTKAIEKIKEFKNSILDKLLEINENNNFENNVFEKYEISIDENLKSKLHFAQNGIIDLIFQNCLVKDDEFFIYDQEWFEENVPIEFLLYRALFYFTELKNAENINDIYKEFGLEEYVDIFENLEKKIQEKILDKDMWMLHANSIKDIGSMEQIVNNYKDRLEKAQSHISDLEEVISKYQKSIEELENTIKNKDAELVNYADSLRAISNSLSWKITKPLRGISEKLKGKSKGN